MVLWLSDPPRHGAEHPVDVRFAPTEAERRHKSGASASRYANIGQGAVCQWHTFSTDRSGNGDVEVRSTEQSVRHLSTPISYTTYNEFRARLKNALEKKIQNLEGLL